MTTAIPFRQGVELALTSVGFERVEKSYRLRSKDVTILMGLQKEHGRQWFVNVGFWLHSLGASCPNRTELTHLYFRLERLFPEYRETIHAAGALGDIEQPAAFRELLSLLEGPIGSSLQGLASEVALRKALTEGRLAHGLIRGEARERLASA